MKRWIGILICIALIQSYAQQKAKRDPKAQDNKVVTLVPTDSTEGQKKRTAEIDGRAFDIIKKMAEAYRSLKSYQFEGTIRTEHNAQGILNKFDMPFTIAAVNPGKLYLTYRNPYSTSITTSSADTTRIYIDVGFRNQFTRQVVALVGSVTDSVIRSQALASAGIDILGEYWSILTNLRSVRFVKEESIVWGGTRVPCTVVEVGLIRRTIPPPLDVELNTKRRFLWIDQSRNIVLVDSMTYSLKGPKWPQGIEMTMVRRFASARLNVMLPDSLFSFTPPGAKLLEGTAARMFTLNDLQGKAVSLQSLRGKVVLLDFWASWCAPCREELPSIQKLHKELGGRGLVVLGINDESTEVASKFTKEQQYSFPSLVDTAREASNAYNVNAIPTVVIIDKEGKIVAHFVGSRSEEDLRKALEKAGIR